MKNSYGLAGRCQKRLRETANLNPCEVMRCNGEFIGSELLAATKDREKKRPNGQALLGRKVGGDTGGEGPEDWGRGAPKTLKVSSLKEGLPQRRGTNSFRKK